MDESELSNLVKDHVDKAVESSTEKLLTDLDALITTRMTSMQTEISQSQIAISSSQMEAINVSIRNSQHMPFKKKGNEAQFKFNSKVQCTLESAKSSLELPLSNQKLEDTKESINQGIELLKARQKLIRLADRSEAGWVMVNEYETNDLAEDSDDERRITRADARAVKKLKDTRLKKSKLHQARQNVNGRIAYSAPSTSGPQRIQSSVSNQNSFPTARRGTCYACGKTGHYRFECNAFLAAQNKISSLNVLANCNCPNLIDNVNVTQVSTSGVDYNSVSPLGRLRQSIDKWEQAGANSHVIDIINNGYKLPFFEIPPISSCQNNRSALDNSDFVDSEIEILLSKGCISVVQDMPTVVNPLTVAFNKDEKKRLVLDCRLINLFLFKFGFKLDGIDIAEALFRKGDYLFTFDLKSAYHHIEICPSHRTYLGFSWEHDNGTRFYVFNVLPFGISTAAFIFTKTVRVMVAYWRSLACRVAMYMDDGCGGASTLIEAQTLSNFIQRSLTEFGFLAAVEKCHWLPSNVVTWLGHNLDMKEGVIMITNSRIQSLLESIKDTVNQIALGVTSIQVRKLATITGKIISMHTAIGPIVQFRTRCLYNCLETRSNWKGRVHVNRDALEELLFWQDNVNRLNGKDLGEVSEPVLNAYSDASAVGYAGYLAEIGKSDVTGVWSCDEQTESSTWRELEAVARVLDTSKCQLSNKVVRWYTDNQNVVKILKSGSKRPHLHTIALRIYDNCQSIDMQIEPEWIPRDMNERADALSKGGDCDDWGISEEAFAFIDSMFGPHTVDRFACEHNHKVARFNSRWHYKASEAVDAFAQSWKNENNLLVPPPRLVVHVLRKLESESACGTLVVPEWRSSPYWPLLCCDQSTFRHFVKGYIVLDANKTVVKCKGRNGIFAKHNIPFNMLAVRLCF